jgi:hypothetical protein
VPRESAQCEKKGLLRKATVLPVHDESAPMTRLGRLTIALTFLVSCTRSRMTAPTECRSAQSAHGHVLMNTIVRAARIGLSPRSLLENPITTYSTLFPSGTVVSLYEHVAFPPSTPGFG